MNFEIYIPGRDADHDAWEALGNKGWGSKDLLKYLKKHEHFEELKVILRDSTQTFSLAIIWKDMELAALSILALEYGGCLSKRSGSKLVDRSMLRLAHLRTQ